MSLWRCGMLPLLVLLTGCTDSKTTANSANNQSSGASDVVELAPPAEEFTDSGETAIDLPVNWQVGDKVQYEIQKTRRRQQAGKPATLTGATTALEIEVLEKNATGFVLGWTLGTSQTAGDNQGSDDLLQNISLLTNGLHMKLQLDELYTLHSIINWQELQQTGAAMADSLTNHLRQAAVDEATITASRTQLQAMLAGEQQITNIFGREPQVFLMTPGGSFSKDPTVYEDALPNVFGGEPFPSVAAFQLKYVDRQANKAGISWHQDLDREATGRIMKQIVGQLTGNPREAEALMNFAIRDKAEFVIDLQTGWLNHLYHNRFADTGLGTQNDTIVFRRK